MDTKSNLKFILILIVIAGVALSGLSSWSLFKSEEKAIIGEFQKDVDVRAASLYRELAINFEALRSLAILFNRNTVPPRELFHFEAQKILTRHSAIQALEWIPRVNRSERAEYELRLQQHYPEFEFTERKEQGIMVPAGDRQEYYPVYFLEPLVGNEAAFGFDLASNPTRLEVLEKSRDTATPKATGRITLVQEQENQTGFLAFLPIYKGKQTIVDKRRVNLMGFVLGVYRIGDIFDNSALSGAALGIDMKLVDEILPSRLEIVYAHKSRTEYTAYKRIRYKKILPEVWGRKWYLVASPTVEYINSRRSLTPLLVMISGVIFTAFVAIYAYIVSRNTVNFLNISRTDGLTGIPNRRHMDDFLNREWFRAIRSKSFISLILIDIDCFKLYNDNYGHLAGDECLKTVAQTLKKILLRPSDLVARYGGEEFAIILPDTEEADSLANKCRKAIEDLQIPHKFSTAANVVTISVGICTLSPNRDMNQEKILDCADKSLYQAKENGRNKVEKIVFRS